MARSFVNVTWNNSAVNYDGTQQQNKHMNPNGTAAIHNYSDEALSVGKETRKSSIPLKHRILPQQRRVNTLTEQMRELCAEYKAGNMDIQEYSQLLAIVTAKRDRAIELLNKAKNTKPKRFDEEAVYVNQEEGNVDFDKENPAKQSVFFSKYKESLVFWGFASIMSIVMLILSH